MDQSTEKRRLWIAVVSLLGVGAQFALLAMLTRFNFDFVAADLPPNQLAAGIPWDQWIGLYCYSGLGFPLLLLGLWVTGVFFWLLDLLLNRSDAGNTAWPYRLMVPAWVLFLALNCFLFLHYGIQNGVEVAEKFANYFQGPAGHRLPQISFVPWLIPLLVLAGLGLKQEFRKTGVWWRHVVIQLPTMLFAVMAEFHVNFAFMGREVLTGQPGLTHAGVVVSATLGVLVIMAGGFLIRAGCFQKHPGST